MPTCCHAYRNGRPCELNLSTEAESSIRSQARTLQSLIDQLEAQKTESENELAAITPPPAQTGKPKTRQPLQEVLKEQNAAAAQVAPRMYKDLNLGRYFALLIGNQNYASLDDLETPLNDIERGRKVLEEKYGFTVMTIADSDNVALMEAINDLYEVVSLRPSLR